MIQFENRTSNTFNSTTLLTSFPAGGGGMAANIYVPGGGSINTNGFFYGRVGYAPKDSDYAVNGYFYGVSSLLNMWWFDGKYTMSSSKIRALLSRCKAVSKATPGHRISERFAVPTSALNSAPT